MIYVVRNLLNRLVGIWEGEVVTIRWDYLSVRLLHITIPKAPSGSDEIEICMINAINVRRGIYAATTSC